MKNPECKGGVDQVCQCEGFISSSTCQNCGHLESSHALFYEEPPSYDEDVDQQEADIPVVPIVPFHLLPMDTGSGLPIPGVRYNIICKQSELAFDIKGASMVNGALLFQFRRHRNANQQFVFIKATFNEDSKTTEHAFYIKACHSNKVFDLKRSSTKVGTIIQQYSLHYGINQQFKLIFISNDEFLIQARHSGLFLEAPSSQMRTYIRQATYRGSIEQIFVLKPIVKV